MMKSRKNISAGNISVKENYIIQKHEFLSQLALLLLFDFSLSLSLYLTLTLAIVARKTKYDTVFFLLALTRISLDIMSL